MVNSVLIANTAANRSSCPACPVHSTVEHASSRHEGCDEEVCLHARHNLVMFHFPEALGMQDFMTRVEIALSGFGFTSDTTISMTNLCRDEATTPLKDAIEQVYGASFNTQALGAVPTVGVTGIAAGLSHAPVVNGREHFVFFSFPHISIDSKGVVGSIARPGRPHPSGACGALKHCLADLQAKGVDTLCSAPGSHNPLDPEYSILLQRLARRARHECADPATMDLVGLTHLAERTATDDLQAMIAAALPPDRAADYAVITGVSIHNWAADLGDGEGVGGVPCLEFVAPSTAYVVVGGERHDLDLNLVPPPTARAMRAEAAAQGASGTAVVATAGSVLAAVPAAALAERLGVSLDDQDSHPAPSAVPQPWAKAIVVDHVRLSSPQYSSFQVCDLQEECGCGEVSGPHTPPSELL